VKYAKANSFHTQLAIAQFGKSARHPLCLAALSLWRLDEEVSRWSNEVVRAEELVNSARQLSDWAQQLRKERKKKEASQASALLRKIDELSAKVQTYYEAQVGIRSFDQEVRGLTLAQFQHERNAVARTGDVKALRALQRVRKRWSDKGAFLGDTDRRTLEMLKMLKRK